MMGKLKFYKANTGNERIKFFPTVDQQQGKLELMG